MVKVADLNHEKTFGSSKNPRVLRPNASAFFNMIAGLQLIHFRVRTQNLEKIYSAPFFNHASHQYNQ